MTSETADTAEAKPKDAVASISGHISVLTTGDHAMLRRMSPKKNSSADGVVIKLLLYAGLKPYDYERDYDEWRLLVHIAALLSGTAKTQPHDPTRGFGKALQAAGLSENRLLRLTAARGEPLHDQVKLVGRMLARARVGAFNLRTLLHLIGSDPDKAEKARLRMAQDYYNAASQPEEDTK